MIRRPKQDRSVELSPDQKVGHWVEMWKKTVEVQQHFNDIEWRIRGLALTVATFAIGAAAVAARDGASWAPPAILIVGLLLWYAFYFVDRFWYHPLLKAAVEQGHKIEDHIAEFMPGADLAKTISAGSPVPKPWLVKVLSLGRGRAIKMRSDHKLLWFYRFGGLALVLSAVGLSVQALVQDDPNTGSKQVVVNIQDVTPTSGPSVSVATPAAIPTTGAASPSTR